MIKVRYDTNSHSLYDLSLGKETEAERGARRSSIIHSVVMIPVASLSDYHFRVAQAVMINNTVASRYKRSVFRREYNSRLLTAARRCFIKELLLGI
jgi:hypothetical protein